MSVLDHCLEHPTEGFPTQDEEFVLLHVDGVEATGFVSHLKLPHYVTFQSKLNSVRKTREQAREAWEQEWEQDAPDGGVPEEGDDWHGTDV
jgi:alpha-D-ribose 1-methylphosphonate 5-triphosphate synthase subunit PhnI